MIKCLDSLRDSLGESPFEVIVVDNGSIDGSGEVLERRDEITLIRNDRNLGFAAAVNQAYRRSTGEFVLLLNSDVELIPDAMSTMTRFLSGESRQPPGSRLCTSILTARRNRSISGFRPSR